MSGQYNDGASHNLSLKKFFPLSRFKDANGSSHKSISEIFKSSYFLCEVKKINNEKTNKFA